MSKHKCACESCCMNKEGNCKLSATQVFDLGCQVYIKIVPEYVDFATAWKAYEEGKEIVSVSHNNIKRRYGTYVNDKNVRFLPEEIRGKWRISEDE